MPLKEKTKEHIDLKNSGMVVMTPYLISAFSCLSDHSRLISSYYVSEAP